ncbi:hypothetical protein CBL_06262 [Carabus blaptoides fortunei]
MKWLSGKRQSNVCRLILETKDKSTSRLETAVGKYQTIPPKIFNKPTIYTDVNERRASSSFPPQCRPFRMPFPCNLPNVNTASRSSRDSTFNTIGKHPCEFCSIALVYA